MKITKRTAERIAAALLAVLMVLSFAACAKSEDYNSYIGYQYSGNDPWGNVLTITLKAMEDGNVSYSFTDVIGEGEDSDTLYAEDLTGTLKDGVIKFNAAGASVENENLTFDYSGTITLKGGELLVTFEDGQVITLSENGDSASMQAPALGEKEKTVKLSKESAS